MLPTIPIMYLIIGGDTSKQRYIRSGIYILSVAVSYMVVGFGVSLFGVYLQAMFQDWVILGGIGVLLVVLAVYQAGVVEFKLSFYPSYSNIAKTIPGVIFLGSLSVLIMSPCVTPALAGILLYIGDTHDVLMGGIGLFLLSLGMNLPLMLVAWLGQKVIIKLRGAMIYSKVVLSVLLLGLSGHFFHTSYKVYDNKQSAQLVQKHEDTIKVIVIGASWCEYCQDLDAMLSGLSRSELGTNTTIVHLDVSDDNAHTQSIRHQYGVVGLPTTIVIKNGHQTSKTFGDMSKSEFLRLLNK